MAAIECADRRIVHHRVGVFRRDIAQAKTGGFDRHKRTIQLGGGVAAAALHIVASCARAL
ncbi:hypothetical protein SDC9_132626 [bioreactor metagenome]|uniref:Uncharacterized protein n=1 Tax=bioreactor metagenome TaxID=1076179 RepID=A0A645D8K4_9ZZZZ